MFADTKLVKTKICRQCCFGEESFAWLSWSPFQ